MKKFEVAALYEFFCFSVLQCPVPQPAFVEAEGMRDLKLSNPPLKQSWWTEGGLVVFVALYFILAGVSGAFFEASLGRVSCWLPLGLYLGWMLRADPAQRWRVVGAAVVAATAVGVCRSGTPAGIQVVFFAIDSATAWGAAWAWQRWWGKRSALDGQRDYLILAGVFLLASLPPALSGIVANWQMGWGTSWWRHALTWSVQAFVGYLLVTPWVMWTAGAEADKATRRWLGRRPWELIVAVLVLAVWTRKFIPWLYDGQWLEIRYVAMPFVVWAASRMGRLGTSWMILIAVFLHARTGTRIGLPTVNPEALSEHFKLLLDVGLLAILGHGLVITIESNRRLARKADQLALVARRTGVGVVMADAEGRLTWVNDAFVAHTGHGEGEVLGAPLWEILVGEGTDREVLGRIREQVKEGRSVSETVLNYRKDGGAYWNRLEVDPVRDERGRLSGFICVQTDVTLLRDARQALERERQIKEFIAEAPVALAMLDRSMLYMSVSRRWLVEYKLGETDLAGRNHFEVLPGMPPEWKEVHRRVLRTGEAERKEQDGFVLPGGETLKLRWEVRPWRSGAGAVEGLIVFSEDIGERLKAEEALRVASERFRLVTQATHDLVWDWELSTGRQWWNDAYHKFWGESRESFTPTFEAWLERVHDADREELIRDFDEFRRSTRLFFTHEFRLRRADGAYVSCLDRAYALRDGNGQIQRMLGAVEDVSARRAETERNLVLGKLEATGALAAGIAHDFNNLLATVLLNLEVIREREAPDRGAAGPVEAAREAVAAARRVTDRLLAFAEGGASIAQQVDIESVVRKALAVALKDAAVTVDFRAKPGLPAVAGEEAQLAQVFQNLALNAREAMEERGELRVEIHVVEVTPGGTGAGLGRGSYVRVRMGDSGPGVAGEIAGRIFDPYFSTKTRGASKGVGLGLTIAQAILGRQGGALRLAGNAARDGGGAVFEVWLQTSAATARPGRKDAPHDAARADAVQPGRASGLRLLVMDDEEMLRNSLQMLLERHGHEVKACADGEEAVRLYAEALRAGRRFDAVLLDLTVPGGVGGEQAMAKLRKLDGDVRAIVMSGYSSADVLRDYSRYGFAAALAKPFRLSDLLAAVAAVRL